MPVAENNDQLINYEITRPGSGPTVLLVSGLGEQIGSVEFPEEQCDVFATAGFQVVRMDNRGTGLSRHKHLDDVDIAPFSLEDMATDVAAVIRDLGVGPVHLVGASMSGWVARWTAVKYPELVSTLTVIMSGSGATPFDDGPQLSRETGEAVFTMAQERSPEEAVAFGVENWRFLWGNGYPFEEEFVRERVQHSVNRALRPIGMLRALQGVTIPGESLWTAQTRITQPTLFIHGELDICFTPDHAVAAAERVPNARLWMDPRMGHAMHREMWGEIAERVREQADQVSATA